MKYTVGCYSPCFICWYPFFMEHCQTWKWPWRLAFGTEGDSALPQICSGASCLLLIIFLLFSSFKIWAVLILDTSLCSALQLWPPLNAYCIINPPNICNAFVREIMDHISSDYLDLEYSKVTLHNIPAVVSSVAVLKASVHLSCFQKLTYWQHIGLALEVSRR